MSDDRISRRQFMGVSAATIAAAAMGESLLGCSRAVVRPTGAAGGIGYFGQFGVDEALVRNTLAVALSRGGEYADLFFQHRIVNYMGLEDGEVNRASINTELGVGVRVVKGDQTGYAYTEDFSPESLKRAAETAAAVADGPARPAPQRFRVGESKTQRYPMRVSWEGVEPKQKLPILADLNARALKADARIKKVSLSLTDEVGVILIADSLGRLVEDFQPMTALSLSCTAEDKGRRESNRYGTAGRAGFEYYTPERLDRVLTEAVARTTILFEAGQPPAGELPVVLACGSSGILLHEAIGHGMEADFNRKGVSIFADRIGKPVAKPIVSIVDDGSLDGSRGAINVDDEGNDAGRTVLVEKGVLASYMHDSISAKHYGVEPTGNGRRQSYAFAPVPRMRATYMLPGPHTKEEIIASVKKGILCETFTNGQVQIGAGDFTFYVKNGWLIEDGKLSRPIKDVNLIGNGPKVLEQIDMVASDMSIDEGTWTCGKDGQSVPVSLGMPTVRVASVTVGGRG
ncbi:MAG: TldD/PmbA family protein [Myxococcales bacterium]|jgi:TldD protein